MTESHDNHELPAAADDAAVPITDTGTSRQRSYLLYVFLPNLFLFSALLGGLRIAADGSFVFVKPPLAALIMAAVLLVLFFRSGLVLLDGWFAENFSTAANAGNAMLLLALFAASVQIFNSLVPEAGIPYWVVTFCFLWSLWNNLFAELPAAKLVRSLAALFGFAFLAKYVVLAGLTAPQESSWLGGILRNPGREAVTWLLDLPRFSAATGYIQFFSVLIYLVGLFLLPASIAREPGVALAVMVRSQDRS
jgi:hypothetical protein